MKAVRKNDLIEGKHSKVLVHGNISAFNNP
jgi:hypothetical protein